MTLNFTLRQLEYFHAVAAHSSISAAAEKQRISRSALASAISDLETALGCRLFTRQKARGVMLTPVGAQLLEMSREVLDSASRIEAVLRGAELSGSLGIGCFNALGPTVVPPLLDHFRRNHPRVTLRVQTGMLEELTAMLKSGEIELAVGYGLNYDSLLQAEEVYTERMHVILPEGHPLAEKDVVSASDLRDETMVLLDTPQNSENVRSYFAGQGFVPRIGYRFKNFEVIRSLVARGVGYSLVIQHPVTNLSYEGLGIVPRPLDPVPFPVSVSVAWLVGRALSPLAREARTALQAMDRPPAASRFYDD